MYCICLVHTRNGVSKLALNLLASLIMCDFGSVYVQEFNFNYLWRMEDAYKFVHKVFGPPYFDKT